MKYLFNITSFIIFQLCSFQVIAQLSESKQALLDEQLATNAKRYGVVGQSVLVLKNHQPIYRGIHGYANAELNVKLTKQNVFPSYSVTKLFTSVLMMQLVESGDVVLKSSVRFYLPYLPERWQSVTVEHLLSHTSGIPRYFDIAMEKGTFLPDKKTVFHSLKDEPDHFKIGSKNSYNNTNFLLLAAILESKTAKSYQQLVNEIIIQPLSLKNTGHASARIVKLNMVSSYQGDNGTIIKNKDIEWPEYTYSHSALYSTPEDLVTFMTALMKGQFVGTKRLKSLLLPMKLSNGKDGSYAFGFEYSVEDGYIRLGHGGGNRVKLRHYVNTTDDADSYTLAYVTNGNANGVWTDVLADSVMAIIEPEVFSLAKLKQQFMTAVLSNNKSNMNSVYKAVGSALNDDSSSLERFFLYRAYSVRYAKGLKASLPAFEFLVNKFPESINARKTLAQIHSEING